jgi:hypothetical protein
VRIQRTIGDGASASPPQRTPASVVTFDLIALAATSCLGIADSERASVLVTRED